MADNPYLRVLRAVINAGMGGRTAGGDHAEHGGNQLACWQIEVTGGGRIWYLLDPSRRIVWITEAGTGHPKTTD